MNISTIRKTLIKMSNSLFHSSTAATAANPIVSINQGKLMGLERQFLDKTTYLSFRGIPYATPPLGDLRFKAPLPPKPWSGIHDATKHGGICPQVDTYSRQILDGDEDCLFLNVYTRSLNKSKPVMIYIYGGGFKTGSGDDDLYGPDFLLQHDVVLVTFNYRLEALGFLCLNTPEVPGNAGMKDQVAVFKWVKQNIQHFGGDPNNVTVFGESAGSTSITYHLVSPMSKGLFDKVIMQSGVFLNYWAKVNDPLEWAKRAAKLFGVDTSDPKQIYETLKSVPAKDLANITIKTFTNEEKYAGIPMYYTPLIEKKFSGVEPFLTEDPVKLLLEKKIHDVPVIIGYNNREGIVDMRDKIKTADYVNKNPHKRIPRDLLHHIANNEKLQKDFGERIKHFYFKGQDQSKEHEEEICSFVNDTAFIVGIHHFAYFYKKVCKSPVYMFRFAYDTENNFLKRLFNVQHIKGACHADDLFYLFRNVMTENVYLENEDVRKKIWILTKMWTDFAKFGNPTPKNDVGVTWQPYTTKFKEYLSIDDKLSMGYFADKENIEFWNKIYAEAGLPSMVQSNL